MPTELPRRPPPPPPPFFFTLKTERNKILHNIRERQIKLKNEEIDRKIEGIDTSKNDHAMLKATRLLN